MRRFRFAILLILALAAGTLLAGCGECVRCDKEQDRVLAERGTAEETESRRDGHLITETWFYWEQGRSVVFLWDERDCSCSVSEYTIETDGSAQPLLHFDTAGRVRHQRLAPE